MSLDDASEMAERRPERRVRVHIDQRQHHTPTPTTGGALYRLGEVRAGLDLFREVRGEREDPVLEDGPEVVHLEEDEHFHSGPPVEITIIVNARRKAVTAKRLSFGELVALAFNPVPTGPNILFTIVYGHGPKANPEGTMSESGSVKVRDRMVFSVTATDKS